MAHSEARVALLRGLKNLGVQLALDDLGTGAQAGEGQGFYFSRPLAAEQFASLLRTSERESR